MNKSDKEKEVMLDKNRQLKVRTDEPQQSEHKETQHKFPQLKVHTGIRSGEFCSLTNRCSQWECC